MTDTWAPQEGKFGKTRDGRKVGPMRRLDDVDDVWVGNEIGGQDGRTFNLDGSHRFDVRGLDLISEWSEPAPVTPSPVREVTTTRKEIVPGVYGRVKITRIRYPIDPSAPVIGLNWADRKGKCDENELGAAMSADELDAAASVFTALAAALRDGAK